MAEDITEYFPGENADPDFYRGKMYLKKDYGIMNADEPVYAYLQGNTSLPLPALVHPDDAEGVRQALEKAVSWPQHIIFRLQNGAGQYHPVYGIFSAHANLGPDLPWVDLELMDIMTIRCKFDDIHGRVLKYRKLMSLSDKIYFEYRYSDGLVSIYEYINGRSRDFLKKTLTKLAAEIAENKEFTFRQKAEFETLCEYLTNHAETVDMEVDSRLFGLDRGYMRLKGTITYQNNSRYMFLATVTLIGEKKHEEKYYMSLYARDSGTGLYNKRAIAELAMEMIAQATENPVFLCILDVDDFKNINDMYGHMAGDEIIAKVAEIINDILGSRGYAGRFGGDEFLIVTDKVKTEDEFVMMQKAIRKNMAAQCAEMYEGIKVTTSVGIAQYPKDASSYEELFRLADKCLYLAKAKGKNRFIIYVPEKHKDLQISTETQHTAAMKKLNVYAAQCREIADIFHGTRDNTRESLDTALERLLKNYDMDRILIYGGDGYELQYRIGRDGWVMSEVPFVEAPETEALFDENGVYAQNQILPVKERNPKLYEMLDRQETEGYLLVKVRQNDGYKMLVAFEILRRQRKWSPNEQGLLYIAARLIADSYYGAEKRREK